MDAERKEMVLSTLDLPPRLYWKRFRYQNCGILLGRDDCVAVGNLAIVQASYQWRNRLHGGFRPYALVAIIHAVHLEAKRHERRHRGEVCDVDAEHWATIAPTDRIDPFEWEDVVLVMSRLCEHDRALLSDRFLGGMTEQQIADCRGLPKSTVHKRLGIAIKRAMSISRCC